MGQAGVDRRVQGSMITVGQKGQPGHGQVLVSFGDGELIARSVRRSVRLMALDDSQPVGGDNPGVPACG